MSLLTLLIVFFAAGGANFIAATSVGDVVDSYVNIPDVDSGDGAHAAGAYFV
jgi:hypothetical protein